MFNSHYPNVRLSEIVKFSNILKNDTTIAENILNVHNCVYGGETYSVVKYVKEKLTSDLTHTYGLFRSVILNSDDEILCFSPPKSISYGEFIEKYPKKDKNIIVEEFVEGTMINVFWNKNVGVKKIEPEKFCDLLIDLHFVSTAKSLNFLNPSDTIPNSKLRNQILKEYAVTEAELKATIKYYSLKPDTLSILYSSMIEKISAKQAQIH
jgi:hypothetical protein